MRSAKRFLQPGFETVHIPFRELGSTNSWAKEHQHNLFGDRARLSVFNLFQTLVVQGRGMLRFA
jgi:hypothetical protein